MRSPFTLFVQFTAILLLCNRNLRGTTTPCFARPLLNNNLDNFCLFSAKIIPRLLFRYMLIHLRQ